MFLERLVSGWKKKKLNFVVSSFSFRYWFEWLRLKLVKWGQCCEKYSGKFLFRAKYRKMAKFIGPSCVHYGCKKKKAKFYVIFISIFIFFRNHPLYFDLIKFIIFHNLWYRLQKWRLIWCLIMALQILWLHTFLAFLRTSFRDYQNYDAMMDIRSVNRGHFNLRLYLP